MDEIGLLFDNDGVLIDSKVLHWQSWEALMKEDSSFQMTHAEYLAGFGKRNSLILEELFPERRERHSEWAERKETLFRKLAKGTIQLLPGMEQFLKTVQKKGLPRIIASSTPAENLHMFLKETPIGQFFTQFVSGEEVKHGKPAPDIFLESARRLNKDPTCCIVFEDAQVGIDAGKAAGCFVVALATTYPAETLRHYDLIYDNPSQLDLDEILQKFGSSV